MALPRTSLSSAVFARQSRVNIRTRARVQFPRLLGRRGYANVVENAPKKAGSDLPWLIGSIAVTVPTCAYLLRPKEKHHHDGGDHGDKHEGDSSSEEHSTAEHDDTAPEPVDESSNEDVSESHEHSSTDETQESDGQKESSNESDSANDESQSETPNTSEDESKDSTKQSIELPRFKGPAKDGPPEDSIRHTEGKADANKLRIESGYGHRQGPPEKGGLSEDESGSLRDEATSSKQALGPETQSGKQEGRSNADTKFAMDLGSMPNIPKKGEGSPESSKQKGTINPFRPQPEQRDTKKEQED